MTRDQNHALPESILDPRVLGLVAVYAAVMAIGTLAAAATRGLVAVVPMFLLFGLLLVAVGAWAVREHR